MANEDGKYFGAIPLTPWFHSTKDYCGPFCADVREQGGVAVDELQNVFF